MHAGLQPASPERMAGRAAGRVRFVIDLRPVTCEAGRTIILRARLVGVMALRTVAVLLDRMEAKRLRSRVRATPLDVTAGAARRRRDAPRTVWAMAGRAGKRAVLRDGLARVAARARRRLGGGVRLMATRALLMPPWCRRGLGPMTARTCRRVRAGRVRRVLVAADALTVAARLLRLVRVARTAQRSARPGAAAVRFVAIEASRRRGVRVHGVVAGLARGLRLMWPMTAGARALQRHRMRDLLAVTARALRGRSRVVLIVTARALVSLGCDHARVPVAARAWLWLEAMRLVAARARVVAHRKGARVDVQAALLRGVTSLAPAGRRRPRALR